MRKRFFSLSLIAALALTIAIGAATAATTGYSLFGDAEYVSPGNASPRAVQIRSDDDPGYGGISYTVEPGTTFGDLFELSTDYMAEGVDDLCVGGSPRFSIGIDTDGDGDRDGSIFAYFGVDSAGTPCLAGWQDTGDFLETGRLLDTSQLPGGTFYDPYDLALLRYGAMGVTSIIVVVDAEWAHLDREQTFIIDNTTINEDTYTYEQAQPSQPSSKDDCKNGGWMDLAREDGTTFKNQGDCVSYTNNGK